MQTEPTTPSSHIYDSLKRGPVALEELRGLVKYRDLVYQLVRRDVVSRYKRSFLGIAWTMLNPLGMMIVLSLVFSQLFHRVQGYPAYLLSGLLAWNFFSQTTSSAMTQMVWGSRLLHRIYVPRTAFVVASIGTGLVNLLLSLVPLVIIIFAVGRRPSWTMLLLPIPILLLVAFSLGVALLIAALAVYFPDVSEMYHILLTAWFYMTPIIYPLDIIPEAYRSWLFRPNPMYYMIDLFRSLVYDGAIPSSEVWIGAVAIAVVTLVLGWIVFSRRSDDLTYRT